MKDNEFKEGFETPNTPKSKQLVRMLSFRVVPAYFREIEKVADKKNITVSVHGDAANNHLPSGCAGFRPYK